MPSDDLGQSFSRVKQMSAFKTELDRLHERLSELSGSWEPAGTVVEQVNWCRVKLAELQARLERKLLILLAGPTGVGKSALLNAFARQRIAEEGFQRPTTRNLLAYCADE
jgi:hypothetical protein